MVTVFINNIEYRRVETLSSSGISRAGPQTYRWHLLQLSESADVISMHMTRV